MCLHQDSSQSPPSPPEEALLKFRVETHTRHIAPKIREKGASLYRFGSSYAAQHGSSCSILPSDALLLSSLEFLPLFFTSASHTLSRTHTHSLSRSLSLFQAVSTAKLPSAFTHPRLLALLLQLLLSLFFSLSLTMTASPPFKPLPPPLLTLLPLLSVPDLKMRPHPKIKKKVLS